MSYACARSGVGIKSAQRSQARDPPGHIGMKRFVFAALLLAGLGATYHYRESLLQLQASIAGKAPETKNARPPPAQVVTAGTAEAGSIPIQVSAIGTVQSIATVLINSRVDGQIAKLDFEEGQDIK